MNCRTFLAGPFVLFLPWVTPILVSAEETPAAPYVIDGERVRLPGWDDTTSETGVRELAAYNADLFTSSAQVYAGQALLYLSPIISSNIVVPSEATHLVLVGHSRPEGEIFPRIRVSLRTSGQEVTTHVLYSGYAQSVGTTRIECKVPHAAANKAAQVVIEILNPNLMANPREHYADPRTFYLRRFILTQQRI